MAVVTYCHAAWVMQCQFQSSHAIILLTELITDIPDPQSWPLILLCQLIWSDPGYLIGFIALELGSCVALVWANLVMLFKTLTRYPTKQFLVLERAQVIAKVIVSIEAEYRAFEYSSRTSQWTSVWIFRQKSRSSRRYAWKGKYLRFTRFFTDDQEGSLLRRTFTIYSRIPHSYHGQSGCQRSNQ